MTDNEIIKALECLCWRPSKCRKCPYSPRYEFPLCQRQIAKDSLDLINRQKTEIDSAKAKIEICAEVIERQDAELKRVKECPKVEKIKAEAYKKFAERIRECCNSNNELSSDAWLSVTTDINCVLKEMVGEKE